MFKKYMYRTLASILEIIEILIISLYNGLLGGFLIPYRDKWNNLIYRIFNRVLERSRIKNVFKYIYYNRSILNYKFKVQGRE